MDATRTRRMRRVVCGVFVAALTLAACSTDSSRSSEPDTANSGAGATARAVIDNTAVPVAIDRRLFGTNVPAWLGPERLLDPEFQAAAVSSGATVLRMPGGSWSNGYDWAGCELMDAERCFWTWAARPSDFASLLVATGIPGMWTVSANQTAESAAAAVAFFNGTADDLTEIGVDRNGIDWGTVASWARQRAAGGHPDPVGIELWEVGNEVYGGKPEAGGSECASFGWEDVWTCDGTQYVNGTATHDGYLDIRRAMVRIDPDIAVGAVGVPDPSGWANWGNEVIEAAADELDFYVVHQYAFDSSPSVDEVTRRPSELWPTVVGDVRSALPDDVPIALTEYNLVSIAERDTEQAMTTVVNALYIADTIGHLAALEVEIANQWNLANGRAENGTDYGLIDADNRTPSPQLTALQVWSRAGEMLYPMSYDVDTGEPSRLRLYPTRTTDRRWFIVAVNPSDATITTSISFAETSAREAAALEAATATAATADSPDDRSFTVIDLDIGSDSSSDTVEVAVPAWSISAIELGPTP